MLHPSDARIPRTKAHVKMARAGQTLENFKIENKFPGCFNLAGLLSGPVAGRLPPPLVCRPAAFETQRSALKRN